MYCVSVEVVVLTAVPTRAPQLGFGDHWTNCSACFLFLTTALDAVSRVHLHHHLEALLERGFEA